MILLKLRKLQCCFQATGSGSVYLNDNKYSHFFLFVPFQFGSLRLQFTCKEVRSKGKAVEFSILWSYMETITGWQMQIPWQIISEMFCSVCASPVKCGELQLNATENNCH